MNENWFIHHCSPDRSFNKVFNETSGIMVSSPNAGSDTVSYQLVIMLTWAK